MKPSLASFYKSTCSWRVRAALELKNIPYTINEINILSKENLEDKYLHQNPYETVPSMEFDKEELIKHCQKNDIKGFDSIDQNLVIRNSDSIIQTLEVLYPDATPLVLINDDRFPIQNRILVNQVAHCIISSTQPYQNIGVLRYIKHQQRIYDTLSWVQYFIRKSFSKIEKDLKDVHGLYCVGDTLSYADITLIPQIYFARNHSIDVESEFPILASIEEQCLQLDAFQKSHPNNQENQH